MEYGNAVIAKKITADTPKGKETTNTTTTTEERP